LQLFRQNRRLTWLALCALALQLVISFGHVHLHGVVHEETAHAASCNENAQSQCPADHDGDHCPICWAINHAGTALLPHAPSIDLPATLAKVFERELTVISYCGSETIKFQARAPPSPQMTV
jgi:hypothetical protein